MKCEADIMANIVFNDSVPPCHEEATENVQGWQLCAGCKDALERIVDISTLVIRNQNEQN